MLCNLEGQLSWNISPISSFLYRIPWYSWQTISHLSRPPLDIWSSWHSPLIYVKEGILEFIVSVSWYPLIIDLPILRSKVSFIIVFPYAFIFLKKGHNLSLKQRFQKLLHCRFNYFRYLLSISSIGYCLLWGFWGYLFLFHEIYSWSGTDPCYSYTKSGILSH